MTISLSMPAVTELKPKITVLGVGGAGGNAVNNMISAQLGGVEFVAANTDAQALAQSLTDRRIQLGIGVTQGLGAGSNPDVGREAAEESLSQIMEVFSACHMLFITAGMGGGTGTGAAPVIAKAAREAGILTVGVATKPFQFEGAHRMAVAEAGIDALETHVDTLIVIPNQNLFRVANDKTTFADAFKMADDVLYSGVRGVTDLMVMPGLINLDFADVRAVMMEMGKAMMGTGEGEGEKRAIDSAEAAISNPLLEDVSMKGARGVLINITGGPDMTLYEVDEAANRIRDEVDSDANIIFGSIFDESLEGCMRVSVVATGIDAEMVTMPRVHSLYTDETQQEQTLPLQAAGVMAEVGQPALAFTADAAEQKAPSMHEAPVASASSYPQSVGSAALAQADPAPLHYSEPLPAAETSVETVPPGGAQAVAPAAPAPAPKAQSAAAQRPLPKAKEEPFIAPRPAYPGRAGAPSDAPDPFVEAAVANARPEEKKRRGHSLFERMTNMGRGRPGDTPLAAAPPPAPRTEREATAAPRMKQPDPTPPAPSPAVPSTAPSPSSAPEMEPAGAAPPTRPTLESNRLAPRPEDELLEIPAFLRRQAN